MFVFLVLTQKISMLSLHPCSKHSFLQVKTKGYKKELAAGKMLYRGFSNLPGGALVSIVDPLLNICFLLFPSKSAYRTGPHV